MSVIGNMYAYVSLCYYDGHDECVCDFVVIQSPNV